MADESNIKRQTTRQDEAVTMGEKSEKGNNERSLGGSESSDNDQEVKEFKEGGYGWYVLDHSFGEDCDGQSILTVGSPGLSSLLYSSSTCTPGA